MRTTNDTKNKGITLIALIITIIVMLILVAVTINMAVNGGLFEKAEQAVGETQNEVNKEKDLANGGITIGGTYYNSIDEYLGESTLSVHNWTRTGDTFKCSHCNTTYEMGQVVNYTPAGKTSTTLSAEMSGLEDDEGVANGVSFSTNGKVEDYTINLLLDEKENGEFVKLASTGPTGTQTIEVQDSAWIVLGIEDTDGNGTNETLLITTAYPVKATTDDSLGRANNKTLILLNQPGPSIPSGSLVFYGAAAYNNGPSEINRICEELYSNSEYGKARGMTIEDVNRTLNYTPHGGEYAVYEDSKWNYYTTGNLTTKLKDVPVFNSLKANGTKTPDGINTEEALGNYELNGYYYGVNNDGTALRNNVNDATSDISVMQRNVIFETGLNDYWLASRGVVADSNSAVFGPGIVLDGIASSASPLFNSVGGERYYGAYLRPVVSLKSKLPEKSTEEIEWGEWNDR